MSLEEHNQRQHLDEAGGPFCEECPVRHFSRHGFKRSAAGLKVVLAVALCCCWVAALSTWETHTLYAKQHFFFPY